MKIINKIYSYLATKVGFRFVFSFISFLYRLINVKKINPDYLHNLEGIKEMDILDFTKERISWISWILRTKNGDDFLEEVVESFINEIDELIIVNNHSTDSTKEICNSLILKYWVKIKYYEYNYDILREDNKPTNSIHSFAYYSNWSISKASYSTILKVDDDNLFVEDLFIQQVKKIKNIFSKYNKVFWFYWWLNYYKKSNKIWVVEGNPYSGRYGDIGFFNLSEKTYFVQKWTSEVLINNYFYYDLGFSYIHMKYFKKNNWLSYSPKKNIKLFLDMLKITKLCNIEKYTNKCKSGTAISLINKVIKNR